MTPDQLFIIALLTIIVPILTTALTIGGGILMFREQNRKLDAATQASKKAEEAANHGKETAAALHRDFTEVLKVVKSGPLAPAAPPAVAEMNVVAESVTVLPTTAVDKEK